MNCICLKLGRSKCQDPKLDEETGAQSCGIAEALVDAIANNVQACDAKTDQPLAPAQDVSYMVDARGILDALPARLTLKLGPAAKSTEPSE